MIGFITEWLAASGLLMLFGLCGSGAVASFASTAPYVWGAAPLAGMLLVPLGANAVYTVLGFSYQASAIAICACLSLTAIYARHVRVARATRLSIAAVVIAAGPAVAISDAATLSFGGPAILFTDGTDHSGYA